MYAQIVLILALLLGAPAPQEIDLSTASIDARLEQLAEVEGADAEVEREALQAAKAFLARAIAARESAVRYRQDVQEAPSRAAALRERLDGPPAVVSTEEPADPNLGQSEQALAQAQAQLAAARESLAELDRRASANQQRTAAMPDELARLQQQIATAQELLIEPPVNDIDRARQVQASAEIEALKAEVNAVEAEREAIDQSRELAPLRREDANRQAAAAERAADFWQGKVEALRRAEAEAAASEAQNQQVEAVAKYEGLEDVTNRNSELADLRSGTNGLPVRIKRRLAELDQTRADRTEVARRFSSAKRRIDAGGVDQGMGSRLQRDLADLPTRAELRQSRRDIAERLSEVQLLLLAEEEERATLGDPSVAAANLIRELDPAETDVELQTLVADLFETRRKLQDSVVDEANQLLAILYDLKVAQTLLESVVAEYRVFIHENILWIRSTDLNPLPALLEAPVHSIELTARLAELVTQVMTPGHLGGRASPFLLLFCLVLILAALRRRLRRRLDELAERVRSYRTDSFQATARALVVTTLAALPIPLLLWSAGWTFSGSADEFTVALGRGLREVASILMALEFIRQLAKSRGLGEVHFRWSSEAMREVRRELRWFRPLIVPVALVALTLSSQTADGWNDSLGRIAFVVSMGILAGLLHRVLGTHGLLALDADAEVRSLIARSRQVWHLVAVALPLVLIVLALTGYYYTATQFELRLRYSLALALGLGLIQVLALRWLFVARRRLAIEQARDRARARAAESSDDSDAGTESGSTPGIDESAIDIPSLDAQTRQLFRSGITLSALVGAYLIWASALPALRGLDRVQLLPRPAILDAQEQALSALTDPTQQNLGAVAPGGDSKSRGTGSGDGSGYGGGGGGGGGNGDDPSQLDLSSSPVPGMGALSAPSGSESQSVVSGIPTRLTLADVMIALLLVALTTIGARNLPGLLEIALLQRLPLDAGARYAITTIVQYLIVVAGISAISTALGIGWEKIQWMAAALTFGLAFGLQEIFANFVSGLIILIERPVRVGDIVTVGSTEGRITKLRMRATTIQDWDRREFLVPNKEFITGSVINWTLTDPVTRVVVPVGIAYGSDVGKARTLLVEAAKSNKFVLDDPLPRAVFRRFGDSTLDFELRVFMANRDLWPQLIDSLHSQIDESFRKAKIEIAFPQRDLHLRSVSREAAEVLDEGRRDPDSGKKAEPGAKP
ncbi:mechanosensitive ion channel domain-containing protein [Engelhardtia mirabilis]|uniref:Mechanosensitive channel MscK n=1 Tax=Engelhardtia mirabilis TaxID=2528011 RepID=A0A518BLD5_9BACT|nr:Mechanosensitive channel MscK precursor [Planctomycetes bacterium Pla133]QDV02118.1 Mechanosensitive channel MscK precursor [Planctomycetes bacterium Pla86]